jgi:hypothetical protein
MGGEALAERKLRSTAMAGKGVRVYLYSYISLVSHGNLPRPILADPCVYGLVGYDCILVLQSIMYM